MRLIQFILVPAFVILAVIYFKKFQTLLLDRALVLIFGFAAAGMVMFPDVTAVFAHWLGVGRGTDLVMYFGIAGLSFLCLILYSKLRTLEARLTELVRSQAVKKPEAP